MKYKHYIELEKFRNQNPDMNEKLNQWLAFIDGERGDLLDMAKKGTAKKLLELGMSLDLIEKATGLSKEEILEVSNQLKKH